MPVTYGNQGRAMLRHPVTRLIASMGVVQGSLFLSGTLLVRGLGVEIRGELAMVSAAVGICSQLGLLGLPAAISYFVARRGLDSRLLVPVLGPRLLGHIAISSVLAGGVLLMLHVLGEPLDHPVSGATFAIVGVAISMVASMCLAAVQGERRHSALPVIQALPILIYALLVLALFITGNDSFHTFLTASIIGWSFVPLATVWVMRRPSGDPEAEVPSGAEMRRFGARAALAGASPTDLMGVHQLLVGLVLGYTPLGLFVIGWAFETGTVLPGAVMSSYVGPRVAAAPPEQRFVVAWNWVLRSSAAAVLICLMLQFILPWLVVLAFGQGAVGAVDAARILVISGVVLGLRRLLGVVLQSMGRPQWSTWSEVLSLVTMGVGVVGLGSAFGLLGACAAMVLAGTVSSAVQLLMLFRLRHEVETETV